VIERHPPTKAIPERPPNFERHFIEGGWRQIERMYGCRDDVVLAWMEQCGGLQQMRERRRQWLMARNAAARASARLHVGPNMARVA
jgi:hypothetical protein